jgi:hypothetical protein
MVGGPSKGPDMASCSMKSAVDDSRPDARAVGSVVVSPALQRWESATTHAAGVPSGRRSSSVTGHDFSRADCRPYLASALAAARAHVVENKCSRG